MAKISLLGLTRKRPKIETRTFTDPDQPGIEWTLTLAPADLLAATRMEAETERLKSEYLNEDGYRPFPIHQEVVMPTEGPIQSVPSIFLNEKLIESATGLWACQAGPEAERYSPEEFIAASLTMPVAYAKVMSWAGELNKRHSQLTVLDPARRSENGNATGEHPGNGHWASWEPSPGQPLDLNNPTHPLSSNSAATSGASTSGSEVSTEDPVAQSGIYGCRTPEMMTPDPISNPHPSTT